MTLLAADIEKTDYQEQLQQICWGKIYELKSVCAIKFEALHVTNTLQ